MKPFEFVLVIISVIIGLAMTEFAIGVSYMIQNYRTAVYYWSHFAFLAFGSLGGLNYWGTLYKLRNRTTWTVSQIGIVFTTSLLFCMIAQVLMPSENNFKNDYKRYFLENANVIYGLLICFIASLMVETYMIKKSKNLKWYLIMVANIVAALSGIIIVNENYRGLLAVLFLMGQLYNMYSIQVIVAENVS